MRIVTVTPSLCILALLCCLAPACGGGGGAGGQGGPTAEPVPLTPEEQRRRDALEALRVRQEAACERLCPRITACSVADAQASLSPEELAKLNLDEAAPALTADCKSKCNASDLSPRQVRVYEVCLDEEDECEPLLSCLDHANPSS
jgi:hypothetical protein